MNDLVHRIAAHLVRKHAFVGVLEQDEIRTCARSDVAAVVQPEQCGSVDGDAAIASWA